MSLTLSPLVPAIGIASKALLTSFGFAGLVAIVWAESALLIGLLLPGEALLMVTGAYLAGRAGAEHFPAIWVVIAAVTVAAVIGAECGYWSGRIVGPSLIARGTRNPRVKSGISRVSALVDRHGATRALIVARFVPLVRSLANPLAGALAVPHAIFARANVLGALLWAPPSLLLGYGLGRALPIELAIVAVIAILVVAKLLERLWARLRVTAP